MCPDANRDLSILIWLAAGQTPAGENFEATGARTFESLSDAVVQAAGEAEGRPESPWILTSDAMFGPEQIKVLAATLAAQESANASVS